MVDMMIAVDFLYFAETHEGVVVVASDDDDLVPAYLASGSRKRPAHVVVLRHRSLASAPNDRHLIDCRIDVHELPPALRREIK